MAQLNISEHSLLSIYGNDPVPAIRMPPLAEQQLAIGAGSVASAAFGPGTNLVRVHADTACRLKFGPTAPTAAATSTIVLSAGDREVFNVPPGSFVAVIAV